MNKSVYKILTSEDVRLSKNLIDTIKGETRVIENHDDPNAIIDCWNSLQEINNLMIKKIDCNELDVRTNRSKDLELYFVIRLMKDLFYLGDLKLAENIFNEIIPIEQYEKANEMVDSYFNDIEKYPEDGGFYGFFGGMYGDMLEDEYYSQFENE